MMFFTKYMLIMYNITQYFQWATKDVVYQEWGDVLKFFKQGKEPLTMEEQQQLIIHKQKYFWKYMPSTFLEPTEGGYYIRQQFIKWQLIKEVSLTTLSLKTLEQLIDLITSYLQYCIDYHQHFDIVGYQKNRGICKVWTSRILNVLNIFDNFLRSSNIIIDNEGNVFFIDICEHKMKRSQKMHMIRTKIFQPFVMRNLHKLNHIVERKKQELLTLLNDA